MKVGKMGRAMEAKTCQLWCGFRKMRKINNSVRKKLGLFIEQSSWSVRDSGLRVSRMKVGG